MNDRKSLQDRIEVATRRWWFFLIVFLIQCVPPITSFEYDSSETSAVIGNILGGAYTCKPILQTLFPVFNLLAIGMVVGVFVYRRRWEPAFMLYAGISYLLFTFVQNVAWFPNGYGIVTNNVFMYLFVALAWFLDAGARRTDFQAVRFTPGRIWVIPLALMAFWYPLRLETMTPDFSPLNAVVGPSGLAFCLMTPVFLTILILCYPRANVVTLRVTGIFGTIIALYNLMFIMMHPAVLWWNGVLHSPLFLISLYAVILGYKRLPAVDEPAKEAAHAVETTVTSNL